MKRAAYARILSSFTSGATSGKVYCGEFIGFRAGGLKGTFGEGHGWQLDIVFKGHLTEHGDSGAPVWDAKTGEVVGIIRGDAEFEGGANFATPLLPQPGYPAEKVPGLLNALDVAGGTELHLERAP